MKRSLTLLLLCLSVNCATAQGTWKVHCDTIFNQEICNLEYYEDNKKVASFFAPDFAPDFLYAGIFVTNRKAFERGVELGYLKNNVVTADADSTHSEKITYILHNSNRDIKRTTYTDGRTYSYISADTYTYECGICLNIPALQLKKAKSITIKFFDKLSQETLEKTISLAGFTKCYNKPQMQRYLNGD